MNAASSSASSDPSERTTRLVSRRAMLRASGVAAGGVAGVHLLMESAPAVLAATPSASVPSAVGNQVPAGPFIAPGGDGLPVLGMTALSPASEWWIRRLSKAGFGVRDRDIVAVRTAGGWEAWVDQQLTAPRPAPSGEWSALAAATEARIAELDAQVKGTSAPEGRNGPIRRMMMQHTAMRVIMHAAWGQDQIRQRMVDLLADLLHVAGNGEPYTYLLPAYDNLLRDGAFGRYEDLLLASAKSPAMLVYLNQDLSRADGTFAPNENYARELMELHSVGVDGGYDETDVLEVSWLLSGWGIFHFNRTFGIRFGWHRLGPLAKGGDVMGWKPPVTRPTNAGHVQSNVESFIRFLANHPATATRVAHIIVRRFVNESLDRNHPLVTSAAEVYRSSGTSLAAVLRHVLLHPDYDRFACVMLRRPLDLMAASLRLGEFMWPVENHDAMTQTIIDGLTGMGQVPYYWETPDGYPWSSRFWATPGGFIARHNALVALVATTASGTRMNLATVGSTFSREAVQSMLLPDHQTF